VACVIVLIVGAAAVTVGRVALRRGHPDVVTGGELARSAPVVTTSGGSVTTSGGPDGGSVRGTLQLATRVPADPRTWVAYLMDGPRHVIRFAFNPPYETNIDTRTLPDGRYTVSEVVFRAAQPPRMTTSTLNVANGPARTVASGPSSPPGGPPPAETREPSAAPPPVVTGPPPEARPSIAPVAQPVPAGGVAAQVVSLTNLERSKVGCPALAVDPRLTAAAQAHSMDMAVRGYFDHDSPDGRTPFQRIGDAGYPFSIAAENIAAGQRTAPDVITGWMNSADHRANIVNCALTQIGVGYATGGSYGTYWTQDFGTP
jgi:uncharacterized protein YkwD